MGDCACLTCRHTWEFSSVLRGLAGPAFVLELLFLIQPDDSNRLLCHGIVRVLLHDLENLCRTGGHTIAAAIAFVRIDGDEIIPGAVTVSIVSQHDLFPVSLFKRCGESVAPLTLPSPARGEGFFIPLPRREGLGEGDLRPISIRPTELAR